MVFGAGGDEPQRVVYRSPSVYVKVGGKEERIAKGRRVELRKMIRMYITGKM